MGTLLLCLTPTANTTEDYELSVFVSNPGLYYEDIGSLSETKATWRLAIHMNLTSLMKREQDVRDNLHRLINLCHHKPDQGQSDDLCKVMSETIKRMIEKIDESMGTVRDLVKPETTRTRRGLIDGLGSIVKAITGNMDAADAEQIHQDITALQTNQRTLKEGMKNQLQVVKSTLDIFNETTERVQQNERTLLHLVTCVRATMDTRFDEVFQQQQIDESLAALNAIVEELLTDVKELVSLLTQMVSGRVNAATLTPRQLIEHLTDALPHLPAGTGFPVAITRSEATTLTRLADARAYSEGTAVVLILDIPLIGAQRYSVSRVYPIPTNAGNMTYYYVDTTEDLVVIDQIHRTYLRMTTRELKECKTFANRYICAPTHPTMPITKHTPCEVQTYAKIDTQDGLHCPKRAIKLRQTLVVTMHQPGRWLYVAPNVEPISIECNGKTAQHEKLNNAGILTLKGSCTVTAPDFSIRTIRRFTQTANGHYLPSYNLTLSKIEKKFHSRYVNNSATPKLVNVLRNPEELKTLGTRVSEIRDEIDKNFDKNPQYYHNIGFYSLSTIAPVALVCFAIYKVYRLKLRRNATPTRPAGPVTLPRPEINISMQPLTARSAQMHAEMHRACTPKHIKRVRFADQTDAGR